MEGSFVNWIDLIQDRNRWRAFVIAFMNLGLQKWREFFWIGEELLVWGIRSSGMLGSIPLTGYRRFGTSYRSHLQGTACPLKMGPIGCPETSVNNYGSTLRNIPEERRSHLHRGSSVKSLTVSFSISTVLQRICAFSRRWATWLNTQAVNLEVNVLAIDERNYRWDVLGCYSVCAVM